MYVQGKKKACNPNGLHAFLFPINRHLYPNLRSLFKVERILHALVQGGGISQHRPGAQVRLRRYAAQASHELHQILFIRRAGLPQHVHGAAYRQHLLLQVVAGARQLAGTLGIYVRQLAYRHQRPLRRPAPRLSCR